MKKTIIFMGALIVLAFYLVLVWDISPEVEKKQYKETQTIHVENTKDYAEAYRAIKHK